MPSARIAISSDLRTKSRFPLPNDFEVNVNLKGVESVSMVAYSVPIVQTYVLTEANNFLSFSEDFLVYSRLNEVALVDRLKVRTVRLPMGVYASLESIRGLLDDALRKVADANVYLTYDRTRNRYTLRSTMMALDGTLRGFHVFKSPLLELFGLDGHSDHLLTGGQPYLVKKADNFVQGWPGVAPVGSTIVIATMLADGVVHSELATIVKVMDNGLEVKERLRFSDYLLSIHTGVLHALGAPSVLPRSEEPPLLLHVSPFNTCTTSDGLPYFATLNTRVMQFHNVALPAPMDASVLRVRVTDCTGTPADLQMGELFIELEITSTKTS